tara:strand:+ start:5459 stop:6709 length:1251 start_codon:yes stop_codon:yes gene_type:complete
MNKYISDNMHTAELEQSLNESKVFPMVKDLCHRYDMRVSQRLFLARHKYDTQWHINYLEAEDFDKFNDINYNPMLDEEIKKQASEGRTMWYDEAFVMTYDGIPQAVVYYDNEDNYCFQANYYIKDRGRDSWDRRTIKSIKVSQVLKSLRKKEWSPLADTSAPTPTWKPILIQTQDVVSNYFDGNKTISSLISDYDRKLSDLTYDNREMLGELIDSLYGTKKPISHKTNEYYENVIKTLDDDKNHLKKVIGDLKEEFENGFISIGRMNMGGFLVGEVFEHFPEVTTGRYQRQFCYKLPNGKIGTHDLHRLEMAEQLDIKLGNLIMQNTQVVRNLEQLSFYDSIKPTLAMLKLKLEQWSEENKGAGATVAEEYFKTHSYNDSSNWFEDLGCYYQLNSRHHSLKGNPFLVDWLLMPKPQ